MSTTQTTSVQGVIDVDELLGRCLGNLEFAERILSVFEKRCAADLNELEEAIRAADMNRVAAISHRLKGTCANAAAHGLRQRTTLLRKAACEGATADVRAQYDALKGDWADFVAALPELNWKSDAPTVS